MSDFYNTLAQFRGTSEAEDNMWGQGDRHDKFYVKTTYRELNTTNNRVGCWPWKMIWKV